MHVFRRRDAEAIRDEVLQVSGKLNRTMFRPKRHARTSPGTSGKPICLVHQRKRPKNVIDGRFMSITVAISLTPLFQAFDQPDRVSSCSRPLVDHDPRRKRCSCSMATLRFSKHANLAGKLLTNRNERIGAGPFRRNRRVLGHEARRGGTHESGTIPTTTIASVSRKTAGRRPARGGSYRRDAWAGGGDGGSVSRALELGRLFCMWIRGDGTDKKTFLEPDAQAKDFPVLRLRVRLQGKIDQKIIWSLTAQAKDFRVRVLRLRVRLQGKKSAFCRCRQIYVSE